MTEWTLHVTPLAAMAANSRVPATRVAWQERNADPDPALSNNALLELVDVTQSLARSQEQAKAAERQVEVLTEDIARLQRQLKQIAQNAAKALYLAYHDQLTGLANRSLLVDRLKQATAQAARRNKQVALLFLDMDGFKGVNDRFGHSTGDTLLQQVAERIGACIRGGDTACRYGGDEFVIMLPETDGHAGAAVAQKIRARLAAPFVIDGDVILITASIGAAVYPVDVEDYNELINKADVEMYLDKAERMPLIQSRLGWPENEISPQRIETQ